MCLEAAVAAAVVAVAVLPGQRPGSGSAVCARDSLFSALCFAPHRGKSVCPPTTLTSVIERETQTRPPPPIPHHRHQADK